MNPFDNLNRGAKLLFAALSLLGATAFLVAAWVRSDPGEPFPGAEAAILLPAMCLFVATAASHRWATQFSKDKNKVDQTPRAAWIGAGACGALSIVCILSRT